MAALLNTAMTTAGCADDVHLLSQMCPGMVQSKVMPRRKDETQGLSPRTGNPVFPWRPRFERLLTGAQDCRAMPLNRFGLNR